MRTVLTISLSILVPALVGCGTPAEQPAQPAEQAATGTETQRQASHAPAGFEAGSHEDWCGEHQVPESMCTRCNPSLIAAFKATGDWCEEHALPESQCLACNPDLKIVRPPREAGGQP